MSQTHTCLVCYLFTVQLLEGIGIMSKSDATQATSTVNYQDDVNVGLDCEHDFDAIAAEDEVDNEPIGTEPTNLVKVAVQKVVFVNKNCHSFLIQTLFWLQRIVHSVRSTPQHRESWA